VSRDSRPEALYNLGSWLANLRICWVKILFTVSDSLSVCDIVYRLLIVSSVKTDNVRRALSARNCDDVKPPMRSSVKRRDVNETKIWWEREPKQDQLEKALGERRYLRQSKAIRQVASLSSLCQRFAYAPFNAMVTKISKWSSIQDSCRITPKIEPLVVYAMPDIPSKFQKDPPITFLSYRVDSQTNKQTKTGKNITSLAEVKINFENKNVTNNHENENENENENSGRIKFNI